MEQGQIPWVSPFEKQIMPVNYLTKREYNGVNLLSLWVTGMQSGFIKTDNMLVISIHSHFAGLVLLQYKTKIRAKKQEFYKFNLYVKYTNLFYRKSHRNNISY